MGIWKRLESLERWKSWFADHNHLGTVRSDHLIECEKCGCLLMKEYRFKRPYTIEHEPRYEYRPKPQPYYPIGYSSSSPDYELIEAGTNEVVREHYQCNRCFADKTTSRKRGIGPPRKSKKRSG